MKQIDTISIEKSKLQLTAAVLFALAALLMIASYSIYLFNSASVSLNYVFIKSLAKNVFEWLSPILFFLACLLLYRSKSSRAAAAFMSGAATVQLITGADSLVNSISLSIKLNNGFSLSEILRTSILNLVILIIWVTFLLTVFKAVKTKIPVSICLLVLVILAVSSGFSWAMNFLRYKQFFDSSYYESYYFTRSVINNIQSIVFPVAVSYLVFTFPKSKVKKAEEGNGTDT
jgi:hypothetical protein